MSSPPVATPLSRNTLVITAPALVEIVQFLSESANDSIPRGNWVEGFGYLFCAHEKEAQNYIVKEAVGVAKGHPVGVQLSAEELALVERLQDERPGLFVGGWFHSHPGLGLFFSGTDSENQMFYQQGNPDGVGLVFDHTKISRDALGLKAFRLDNPNAHAYHEVPFKIRGLSAGHLEEALALLSYPESYVKALYRNLLARGIIEEPPQPDVMDQLVIDAKRHPLDPAKWRTLGLRAWEAQDLDLAFTAWQKVSALVDRDLEALIYVYLCYIKGGDAVIARDVFHQLIDIIGDNLSAWVDLGEQLAALGDYSGATNCYIQAIRYDPTDLKLVTRLRDLSVAQADAAKDLSR